MTYQCSLVGSPHKFVGLANINAPSRNDAIQYALGAMLTIYEKDKLHKAETLRAFKFWTPDVIRDDLDLCGRCDIVICGGHYIITLERTKGE